MQNRLREKLARLWTSWRRRGGDIVKTAQGGETRATDEARNRFWAEFREGQRHAEAHSAGPR